MTILHSAFLLALVFDFGISVLDHNIGVGRPFHHQRQRQQQQPRELQQEWIENPSFVSEPIFHYSGYRFNVDYRISATLDAEKIVPGLWTDSNCEFVIEDGNPVMPYQLILDPTDSVFGDIIEGTRTIRVTSLIKPELAVDARFVSHKVGSNFAAVNFCATIEIRNDFTSNDIAFRRENLFNLDVDVTGSGIQAYLQDDAIDEAWQVDMYRCDDLLERIPDEELASMPPVKQGQHVKLCVETLDAARRAGAFIHNINLFTYQRVDDGLVQSGIENGQIPAEDGLTQILCRIGNDLCAIDTVLQPSFFHSPGIVEGSGEIRLQFGLGDADQPGPERHLNELAQWPSLNTWRNISALATDKYSQVATTTNRRLYERENIVAILTATINIDIEPSSETYTAEAFRCNSANEEIDMSIPVVFGEGVRICVRPDKTAQKDNVYVRRIQSFAFQRDVGASLLAIDDDGVAAEDGRTLVICSEGSSTCALKTELPDWFFVTKGVASVTGTVVLQFGNQQDGRKFKAKVFLRRLQAAVEDDDAAFAGQTQILTQFYVAFSTAARKNPRVWWSSSPPHLKFLYALAITIASLIGLCCILGCCFFCFKQRQAKEFIMNDIMDMNIKETDESVDAFADSRASYYSDLDFDTDASGNSSDVESISEKFDEDLEEKVAILFPQIGEFNDLTQPLGLSSSHTPTSTGPTRRTPARSRSQPLTGMTQSLHAAPGHGHPGRGHPAQRRPADQLSHSEHYQRGRGPGPNQPLITNTLTPRRASDPMTALGQRRPTSLPPVQQRASLPGRMPQGRAQTGRGIPQRNHSFQPMARPSLQGNLRGPDRLSQSEHARPPVGSPPQKRPSSNTSVSKSFNKGCKVPKAKKAASTKNIEYDNGQHKDGITKIPVVGQSPKKNIHPGKHESKALKAAPAKSKKKSSQKSLQSKPESKKKEKKSSDSQAPGSSEQQIKNGKKDSSQQSASTSSTSMEEECSTSDEGVRDNDVCFEADGHPGTDAFLAAVRASVKKFGPSAYSPKIYRHIKKQLPGRRFYVCEDDSKLDEWSDVTNQKGKLIDLFYLYHQQALSQAFGATIMEETEGALEDDLSPAN